MRKQSQDGSSNTPRNNPTLHHDAKAKEKMVNTNRTNKQKTSKRKKEMPNEKLELDMNQLIEIDPVLKNEEECMESSVPSKDIIFIGHTSDQSHDQDTRGTSQGQGKSKIGNRGATISLSVVGAEAYHTDSNTSNPKPQDVKTSSSTVDGKVAKSTHAMNKTETLEGTDVPCQNLDKNPKISLALVGPSSISEDASDTNAQNDLTEPSEEYIPTRYENNSSYAAAIRGGASLSLSESWKGALQTSCSSSIQGSHESLKFDNSQTDDTLRSNLSATSASPKLLNRQISMSPMSSGNVVIPLITTDSPCRETSLSPNFSVIHRRKSSHGSRFSRQQSQPSPKDQRYIYREIRRSISNKTSSNEDTTLRHVCSLGVIGNDDKSICCLKKHHCCSLHNCGGITANACCNRIENQKAPDTACCNYLHVHNDLNSPFQCHHGHPQQNRICRNGACMDTTTHIIGSGMCTSIGTDSIASIAADSLKFKGATKTFKQVIDIYITNILIRLEIVLISHHQSKVDFPILISA